MGLHVCGVGGGWVKGRQARGLLNMVIIMLAPWNIKSFLINLLPLHVTRVPSLPQEIF